MTEQVHGTRVTAHRRQRLLTSLTAVSLLLTGCGTARPGAVQTAPSTAAGGPTPAVSGTKPCPTGPGEHVTGDGTALRVTLDDYFSSNGGRDWVIPAESLAKVPEAASANWAGEGLDRHGPELVEFAEGGLHVSMSIENTTRSTLTVTDVRPANIVRECRPLGLALRLGNEGGSLTKMTFDLEAAAPRAHWVDDRGDARGFYFEDNSIELAAGGKQELEMDFTVATGSYSFDVAIRYEIDGKLYTALVRDAPTLPGWTDPARPFRATASLCPSPTVRKRLSAAQIDELRLLRYQHILKRGDVLTPTGWNRVAVSPEEDARDCPTL